MKKIFAGFIGSVLAGIAVIAAYASQPAVLDKNIAPNPVYDRKDSVSMDFENADLKNVLKALSAQTGINFVASEVVENKRVTVYLNNVSVEAALASILEANGLFYEKQAGNVYLVKPTGKAPLKMITKVFKLNYLQVYKMSVPEGTTGSTSGITIIGQPAMAEAGSFSQGMMNAPTPTGEAGDESKKAKTIIDVIRSLMSQYGKIVADRRNNCLIITDIPDVFDSIQTTIDRLDIEPIQVMIQAEIIETTTSAMKKIGIEYGTETQLAQVTYTGSSSTSAGSSDSSNPTFPTPFPFTENFIKDTYGTSLASSGLFSYGTLTVADTQIVLKLLALDSDTKYLSRPKIMTINNEPAVIKISANSAIGTNATSVSTTGQSIATAERTETGVILRVTPQVNDKGDIFMYIEPSVSRTVVSTLSTAFLDPSYRSSISTVMIKDMETVVVAGLIQTNNYKTSRKVPILGDIPVLGEPFKSRYNKVEDTELLIFITPHVVKRRDREYVTPKSLTDREYSIEKALVNYTAKTKDKKATKPDRPSKEAVTKRENAIEKFLKKYAVTTKSNFAKGSR